MIALANHVEHYCGIYDWQRAHSWIHDSFLDESWIHIMKCYPMPGSTRRDHSRAWLAFTSGGDDGAIIMCAKSCAPKMPSEPLLSLFFSSFSLTFEKNIYANNYGPRVIMALCREAAPPLSRHDCVTILWYFDIFGLSLSGDRDNPDENHKRDCIHDRFTFDRRSTTTDCPVQLVDEYLFCV